MVTTRGKAARAARAADNEADSLQSPTTTGDSAFSVATPTHKATLEGQANKSKQVEQPLKGGIPVTFAATKIHSGSEKVLSVEIPPRSRKVKGSGKASSSISPIKCLRGGWYLSLEIFESIIKFTTDKQTLYAWQRVDLTCYAIATPLLYTGIVTISTNKGYRSFLCGSHKHPMGLPSQRLIDKKLLLPLMTGVKSSDKFKMTDDTIRRFMNTDVKLFSGFKAVWIVHSLDFYSVHHGFPDEATGQWMRELECTELHVGDPVCQLWNKPVDGYPEAFLLLKLLLDWGIDPEEESLEDPQALFPAVTLRQHESPLRYSEITEYVFSPTATDFQQQERFRTLFDTLHGRAHCPCSLCIYGIGKPPPRKALYDTFTLYYPEASDRIDLLAASRIKDIDGDEAQCQAMVEAFFSEYLKHFLPAWGPHELEFKLYAELPAFGVKAYPAPASPTEVSDIGVVRVDL